MAYWLSPIGYCLYPPRPPWTVDRGSCQVRSNPIQPNPTQIKVKSRKIFAGRAGAESGSFPLPCAPSAHEGESATAKDFWWLAIFGAKFPLTLALSPRRGSSNRQLVGRDAHLERAAGRVKHNVLAPAAANIWTRSFTTCQQRQPLAGAPHGRLTEAARRTLSLALGGCSGTI